MTPRPLEGDGDTVLSGLLMTVLVLLNRPRTKASREPHFRPRRSRRAGHAAMRVHEPGHDLPKAGFVAPRPFKCLLPTIHILACKRAFLGGLQT
jgi:hypothetical protein